MHVEQSPGIRREGAQRRSAAPVHAARAAVVHVQAVVVGLLGADRVAHVEGRARAGAAGVLPFRFAGQAVLAPGTLAHPRQVQLRIVPAHPHHGVLLVLHETGIVPVRLGTARPAGRLDEGAPFPHADGVARQRERALDADPVLRQFALEPRLLRAGLDGGLVLRLVRAHLEAAAGNEHQFRPLARAIEEIVAQNAFGIGHRFRVFLLRRRRGCRRGDSGSAAGLFTARALLLRAVGRFRLGDNGLALQFLVFLQRHCRIGLAARAQLAPQRLLAQLARLFRFEMALRLLFAAQLVQSLLFQRRRLDFRLAALVQLFLARTRLLDRRLAGLFGRQRRLLLLLRQTRLLLARQFRQFLRRWPGRPFQPFQQGLHGLRPQFRRQRKPVLQHLPLRRVERLRLRRQVAGAARVVERHAPFEHLVNHHGHRVHVQARAGLALVRARLGRAVTLRARVRRFQPQAAARIAHARGDTVVEQLDVALRRQEDIARLEVAVHQLVLLPRIRQRVGHRLQQLLHGRQGQRPLSPQIMLEVFAIEAFHDDEIAGRGRVLRPLVDAHDVFMRQLARLGRFLDQQLGMRGALRQLRRQDLQRHHFAAAQLRVRGQVGRLPHLPHAARADQPFEPVAAVLRTDFLARHEAQLRALARGRRRGRGSGARRRILGVEDGVLAAFKFLLAEQPVVVEGAQFPQFFSCFLHHLG